MLDWVWGGMILLSCLWGAMEGKLGEVSAAALAGVEQAVDLCMGLCAGICLWSGLLRLLERGGVTKLLSRAMQPLLRRLYPLGSRDPEILAALTENLTANSTGDFPVLDVGSNTITGSGWSKLAFERRERFL